MCVTCFGTLCNVDPVGEGGLGRFFKMDPAGLSNICSLSSLLLSAVGKSSDATREFIFFERGNDLPCGSHSDKYANGGSFSSLVLFLSRREVCRRNKQEIILR